jgi:glycosyltransferase involved in cell wall biosynthesis
MKFSVILPCHNAERWVAQALASAAGQSHAPHEIIVINDASSDDSAGRIRASGVAVRLLEMNLRNAAAARNAGAAEATGDWLAFLDADDYWLPHHLEAADRLLSGSNDVAYTSIHDDLLEEAHLQPAENPWPWLDGPRGGLTAEDFMRCWGRVMYFSMPSTVVRADRFRAVGGLDEAQLRRHDSHLWWRLIHEHTWAFDPRPDCVCRVDTPQSVSRTSAALSAYDGLRALLKTRDLYPQSGYERVLGKGAFVAMAEAVAHGTAEERRRAWELARPFLTVSQRMLFASALWSGGANLLGRAVRARRRWRGRSRQSAGGSRQ